MERDGTTFIASHSSDGSTWNEITTFDLATATTQQDVGVAVTSSTAENARAEFGEFEVTGSTTIGPLPDKYTTFNNGSADPQYGASNGTLHIEGTGKSADSVDEYTAVYLDDGLPENATAVAKINNVELVSEYSTAGFIVRNDITQSGSSLGYAQAAVNQNGGEVKFDENANGYLDEQGSSFTVDGLPAWIRMVRDGTSYTIASSADGSNWSEVASFTLENATAIQDIGIAVTAPVDENTAVEIGEFEVTTT
jgi:regulation of enolase protein 1 (concanavalin A-like superfamily)